MPLGTVPHMREFRGLIVKLLSVVLHNPAPHIATFSLYQSIWLAIPKVGQPPSQTLLSMLSFGTIGVTHCTKTFVLLEKCQAPSFLDSHLWQASQRWMHASRCVLPQLGKEAVLPIMQ